MTDGSHKPSTFTLGTTMEIIIETFRNPGEPSSNPIRVRPIPGQNFPPSYRVWCSVAMRESKSVGALFRVNVSLVHQPDGDSYLRISRNVTWVPVSTAEARNFISANKK